MDKRHKATVTQIPIRSYLLFDVGDGSGLAVVVEGKDELLADPKTQTVVRMWDGDEWGNPEALSHGYVMEWLSNERLEEIYELHRAEDALLMEEQGLIAMAKLDLDSLASLVDGDSDDNGIGSMLEPIRQRLERLIKVAEALKAEASSHADSDNADHQFPGDCGTCTVGRAL